MSNPIPSQISLATIANGTLADGSVVQSNYAAIQAAVNDLITALSNGTAGQFLQAVDGADVVWGNAADKSSAATQTFTAGVVAPSVAANSLSSGGTSAALIGTTASGAPASGTHFQGNIVVDLTGKLWICTAAGTPGTWVSLAAAVSPADKASTSTQSFAGGVQSTNATEGIGYATGSGGAVTIANLGSGTLNKVSGQVTASASVANSANYEATVTNSTVGANDAVVVSCTNGTVGQTNGAGVTAVSAGSFSFGWNNNSGGTITPVFNFVVIKGAAS